MSEEEIRWYKVLLRHRLFEDSTTRRSLIEKIKQRG